MRSRLGVACWLLLGLVGISLLVVRLVFKDNYHVGGLLLSEDEYDVIDALEEPQARTICNPRQMLCERKRDPLFDGLHKIDAQELVHRTLTKMNIQCLDVHLFGVKGQGGWEACVDKAFVFKKNDCLVYSFGVGSSLSFEEAVIQEYGCEVHTFDPLANVTIDQQRVLSNWTLHKLGIWGDDFDDDISGTKRRRFLSIIKMLGHENRIIDYVKLDGQGGEWPFMRDLSLHPESLDNVKQLAIAAYAPRRKPREQSMRMTDYSQVFRAMSTVKRLGFRNYFFHAADMSQSCCKWWADLVPPVVSGAKVTICCYRTFLLNMNYF